MEKVGDLLREKILIVDDMRFQRAMASDILTRRGYATVEVDNGARLLEMVNVESPDLVILDARMPTVNGMDLCRRLKQDPFTNHIPILIFTSPQAGPDRAELLRAGADSYLGKPFSPDELAAHVEALLRRSFDYDPLTQLPAAPYLHRQIDARLAQNQPTAVVYADLDHFQAYNRAYGHSAGDRVLMDLAKLLVESLPARGAFVGHLGSDDFMAVLPPETAETFAQTVVEHLHELRPTFYSDDDLNAGYVLVENRRGQPTQAPLLTLAAALVSNERRALINYVQVSDVLSEVMRYVKALGGGRWARDRRTR